MGSLRRASVVLLYALLATACDFAKTTTQPSPSPPPNSAHIQLTIAPSPVPVKVDCPAPTNPDFCLASLSPTVTVVETAGLGGRVNPVAGTIRNLTPARDANTGAPAADRGARPAGAQ